MSLPGQRRRLRAWRLRRPRQPRRMPRRYDSRTRRYQGGKLLLTHFGARRLISLSANWLLSR